MLSLRNPMHQMFM